MIVSLLYLFTFPFDRFNQIPNRTLKGLARSMLAVNPGWDFIVEGAEADKVTKPTIVIANHQSFLDLPLFYLLPWSMKWVAKKSLFKIPILGWIIFMTGQIAIERYSLKSLKKLDYLVQPIQNGIPGMIFPEGTRTEDGNLKAFKNGAFLMAKRYNFNLLPIVHNGGYEAMPSGSWRIDPRQTFRISVLDPIDPQEFENTEEIKETAYLKIERELERLQKEKS
ncbi:MAG TPA: lysophospholipid acyltransferase family protein [Halalkalibaculum sp.]|nr:lysophospholipid acyltransferase family protein [Halalkalibaculum sp.]